VSSTAAVSVGLMVQTHDAQVIPNAGGPFTVEFDV
jgi:hypothetical protein